MVPRKGTVRLMMTLTSKTHTMKFIWMMMIYLLIMWMIKC
jgi:hypothetical protein